MPAAIRLLNSGPLYTPACMPKGGSMQFLLMLYVNEAGWPKLTTEQQQQGMAAYLAYSEELEKAGVLKAHNSLQSSFRAKTVRLADGKPRVLDGPYAESKEQVGGYYLIDVPDLDVAISWAARCPAAGHGVVEIRTIGRPL
jgi:hypothetical protein